MRRTPIHQLCIACSLGSLALLTGCGESEVQEVAASTEQPTVLAGPVASNAPVAEDKQETTEPEERVTEPSNPELSAAIRDYQPPFPHREDLFTPPNSGPKKTVSSANDSEESVVLMGFADLGTPKVVLEIDGEVTPMAMGDQSAGVEVISINPPQAVLQRGRTRWTASLN